MCQFGVPNLTKNIDKLEYIQQRASKLVPGLARLHVAYDTILLYLYSLYCRRQRGDLIEVFKLMNQLTRVSPDPFFTIVREVSPEAICMIQGYS